MIHLRTSTGTSLSNIMLKRIPNLQEKKNGSRKNTKHASTVKFATKSHPAPQRPIPIRSTLCAIISTFEIKIAKIKNQRKSRNLFYLQRGPIVPLVITYIHTYIHMQTRRHMEEGTGTCEIGLSVLHHKFSTQTPSRFARFEAEQA